MPLGEVLKNRSFRLIVKGLVQGVGFRPFVYKTAQAMGIFGGVRNNSEGVEIKIIVTPARLQEFITHLQMKLPEGAKIESLQYEEVLMEELRPQDFQILQTESGLSKDISIPPDQGVCSLCLDEFHDPQNRRYHYPFIACAQCGPRFSILRNTPFDRVNTSLSEFPMCKNCQREYETPEDRRFHAQGICCPICGPQFRIEGSVERVPRTSEFLNQAVLALKEGQIVAVKGVSGYQFLADATNKEAVKKLRRCKRRPEKPFAVMLPSLSYLESLGSLSLKEKKVLESSIRPIVLVRKQNECSILCDEVAPGSPYWGIILPYSGIHYLISNIFQKPLIFTSANFSEEPLLYKDDAVSIGKLSQIADIILTHNLNILRPLDDSIIKIVNEESSVLRLGRGLVPFKIQQSFLRNNNLELDSKEAWFSKGSQGKSSIALVKGTEIILGPYLGNLSNSRSFEIYEKCARDLSQMLNIEYVSGKEITEKNFIPHHQAHLFSVVGENHLSPPYTGLIWDGIGLSEDGQLWGCEAFSVPDDRERSDGLRRIGTLRSFLLLGGDVAAREPRRVALALLWEIWGDHLWGEGEEGPALQWARHFLREAFSTYELKLFQALLGVPIQRSRKEPFPRISSMGRLFDGVASLLGVCHRMSFEAQAAMLLESLAWTCATKPLNSSYPLKFENINNINIMDFEPLILGIIDDLIRGISKNMIAQKFHVTLGNWIVEMGRWGQTDQIILSGGCFQNQLLLESAIAKLQAAQFRPFWNKKVPANDGGIAFGLLTKMSIELAKKEITPIVLNSTRIRVGY